MSIYDTILNRRTVHLYKDEPIAAQSIERAIKAATFAPNHKLSFPWKFISIGKQTRKQLYEIAISLQDPQCLTETKLASIAKKILHPAELIVFTFKKNNEDPFRAREDYATLACAIQNFMLCLSEENIGTKWSSGKLTRHEKSYQLFEIDSNQDEIVGFLWAGKAECTPSAAKRPSLEETWRKLP